MSRSTWQVILIKNSYTLWGRGRVHPFTLRVLRGKGSLQSHLQQKNFWYHIFWRKIIILSTKNKNVDIK